jgi:hypothetical protein
LIGLVGEKPHFDRPSPEVGLLNREDFTRADLDPASYVAIADFERKHVEDEIRAALEKTFGGAASPQLIPPTPANPAPDDFVAYAYLYKNLAFANPFTNGTMTFSGKPVQDFGFPDEPEEKLTHQVQIYDYQSRDDFIVSLTTKSPADELILAKVKPGATLEATFQGVLDRMSAHLPEPASGADRFAAPKLNFDLRRHFHELEGLTLLPSDKARIKSKLTITEAQQLVRFQLNEKGAVLKSEATIVMKALAMAPRHLLIFDKPFLVLLKQKDSGRPYFALWIGNPSLLIAAKDDAAN